MLRTLVDTMAFHNENYKPKSPQPKTYRFIIRRPPSIKTNTDPSDSSSSDNETSSASLFTSSYHPNTSHNSADDVDIICDERYNIC